MVHGNINPKNVLSFNKKSKDRDVVVDDSVITVDNILDKASSDNVSDALKNLYGTHGILRDVRALNPNDKVAGFIRTVETNSDDWGTCIKGIYASDKDDILLIKCSDDDYAVWGGLASCSASVRGLQATVIIGCSRDTEDILDIGYPVFSRGVISSAGLPSNRGVVGRPLIVEDMVIRDGDFIIGDVDGVVVVSSDCLDDVLLEVARIKEFEADCFRKVVGGEEHLDDIVGF